MPGRKGNTPDYRYGFQGQEMDNEIKGEGNSLNYKYRMHDPRVGRFFAVDPMESIYNWFSPYAFSGNRVIDAFEMEGMQPFTKVSGKTVVAGVKFKVSNSTEINTIVINKILEQLKSKFKTQLSRNIKTSDGQNRLEGAIVIDNTASYEILFLTKEETRKRMVAEGLISQKQSENPNLEVKAIVTGIGGDKILVSDETLGGLIGDWIGNGGFLESDEQDIGDVANTIFHEIGHLLGLLHTYPNAGGEISTDIDGEIIIQIASIRKLWNQSEKEIKAGTFNMPGSATRIIAKNIMSLGQKGGDVIDLLNMKDALDDKEIDRTDMKLRNAQVEAIYKTIKEYENENND